MLRTTVKGLLARKLRLLTTSLAVLLGVAFMSGTLVLTDTIGKTFDSLFADVYDGTDAYVRSPATVGDGQSDAPRPRVAAELVDTVAAVPGVERAEGTVRGYAQVVGSDGKVVGDLGNGAPTYGSIWSDHPDLNAFNLVEGRAPAADDEVVIDRGVADEGELQVGSRTTVLTQAGSTPVTVSGIATFGEADNAGGASFVLFTSTASTSTERMTWRRLAPMARSRAISRVRWATMIENVLWMMNDPTKRAITANVSMNVLKKPMPDFTASCSSAVISAPVSVSTSAGSASAMRVRSSS